MQIIELYIQGTKVDLFKDESISITDSIQNIKDISKIFTAFSQQFNLPASKTNNRLFRHYYNFEIDNSFDARFKVDAEIKLNGITYKRGKIKLNEVSLKDNIAHSYKVVFFGDTIELKDLINDDLLSELPIDNSLDFTYDLTNVKSRFENMGDIVVPLITHSKRFQMDNNGHYRDLNNNKLDYVDLKPAIRVKKIIDAIEEKYEIDFSNEFFNTRLFTDMFLWLHRNEGFISNSAEGGGTQSISNRFHVETSPEENYTYVSGTLNQRPLTISPANILTGNNRYVKGTITLNASGNTSEYTVSVISSNGELFYEETTSGNQTMVFEIENPTYEEREVDFNVVITSENTFTLSHTLRVEYIQRNSIVNLTLSDATYNSLNNSITNTFRVAKQMPKTKVYDFLVNLFKMFNLTAYKEDNTIRVQPLNDFYDEGVKYDITEYVDMSKSTVTKLLQYKNIDFNFKSQETQLVKLFSELQGIEFSEESYGNDAWDGGDYKVELDFEKMLYERLTDTHANPDVLTNITQGTFVGSNGDATIGKPLLFYPIVTSTIDYPIEWQGDGTSTSYIRPSQLDIQQKLSLNFGLEADEFFREPRGENLFSKYYLDYVANLFNNKGRKVKVSAYLPLHLILRYKLNDRFIISGKTYKINSIKTNLLTNKSDLELIPDLESIFNLQFGINPNVPRPRGLRLNVKTTNSIEVAWDAVSGASGYDVYLDDENLGFITGEKNNFTGLDSGVTYKLGVQAVYKDALDVVTYRSPITNFIETTD